MKDIGIMPLTPEAERLMTEMGNEGWLPMFDKAGNLLFKFVVKKKGR